MDEVVFMDSYSVQGRRNSAMIKVIIPLLLVVLVGLTPVGTILSQGLNPLTATQDLVQKSDISNYLADSAVSTKTSKPTPRF